MMEIDMKLDPLNYISNCSAILLDIEGTTTSIDFVKKILFPHAQRNASKYLSDTWDNKETGSLVESFLKELKARSKDEYEIFLAANEKERKIDILADFIDRLICLDEKLPALKVLQGLVWKSAYEDGDIKGHVYEDVKPAFEKWNSSNLPIYIYSSGSIAAQKLLFRHSMEGDLLHFIKGHFDTTVGPKVDSKSYMKIAELIEIPPEKITFITDLPKEAHEAKQANMKVILSVRPGTVLFEKEVTGFPFISNFNQLFSSADKC